MYSLTSQDASVMIIDAGHINVDSQLADKEVVNDLKNKEKQSKQDALTLESLMYDKFNLHLSQTKILIGSNTEECLWQLQGHPPLNGVDSRFVEPIDMNFLIELCILPGKTEFTKIKVSGQLPLLSVNLSDSKYKILMKIVDFIVPKTDDERPPQPAKRPQMLDSSQRSQSNIITERFWGYSNNDILLSDSASDKTSIKSDAPTTATASIALSEVEQFKLIFHVDKVSATICETSSSDPTKESLLCEVLLESFELNVVTRPNDLLVDVSLKALNVIDKLEHAGDFHYLVTSDIIDRNQTAGHASSRNLVNVKYIKASKEHPQFMETYNGYDQTIDVALSTLTVIVTRKSLVRIYSWIMNTFTDPPSPTNGQEVVNGDVFYNGTPNPDHRSSSTSDALSQRKPKITTTKEPEVSNDSGKSNRMKVVIHMDSVDLILNNEGIRMGTAQLSFAQIVILLEPKTKEIQGKFGNFTLFDDTVFANETANETANGSATSINSVASETYIISIVGEELADFTFKTYDQNDPGFPGYTQKFDLRMAAIQIFVTDSIKSTLTFLQEFLAMVNASDATTNAPVETAQQSQNQNNGFHYDVIIKSPVLIISAGENKKTDTLVANLGEIRANNKFINVHRRDLKDVSKIITVPGTHLNCGLYDISLHSIAKTFDKSGKLMERVLPIINDLDIVFDIEGPLNPNEIIGPSTQIQGNISDVRMSLTERQYKSLLEAWEFIQKSFLAADEIKDGPQTLNDSEETVRPDEASAVITSSQSHSSVQTSAMSTEPPKITLDLNIKLNTVCLEVLNGEELDIENRHKQKLAGLAFDGICFKHQSMSNETMLMEVSIQSISFADTRQQSKSKFREILPANTLDGPQFQLQLKSYKREDVPIMDIHITVDSPKIILSLDYLFLLKNFFMSPFIVIEPTAAQKYAQSHGKNTDKKQQDDFKQIQRQSQPPATVWKYYVNVVDLQVLCLANPENEASEAVILSFNQLTVDQECNLKVNLNGISMALCRMNNRDESTMHFVEEFSVLLKVETASTSSVHNLMSITLNVQPIILRLSYQDAMLITTIANKGTALMGAADTTSKPSEYDASSDLGYTGSDAVITDDDESNDHLAEPGSSGHYSDKPKGIEPFIVMSKESVSIF
jgi:vacuolar protein sorting-associated protein 13A/C